MPGESSNGPCVYILYFDFGNPYAKIGITRNLRRRLVSLATPETPSATVFLRCETFEQAQLIEAALLTYLRPYRRNGEWFSGAPGDFPFMLRSLIALIDAIGNAWQIGESFERYVDTRVNRS